jgi:hypothetical protein
VSQPMLATIDDATAAQVDRDRKVHGVAFTCVLPDGSVVHVPAESVLPHISPEIAARWRTDPRHVQYRIAKVAG